MEVLEKWKDKEKTNYIVCIAGDIDTSTADDLATYLTHAIEQEPDILTLDFSDVTYVTSAGLRVLLAAQKKTSQRKRRMLLQHVNAAILNVLEMTGFTDILEIVKEGGETP